MAQFVHHVFRVSKIKRKQHLGTGTKHLLLVPLFPKHIDTICIHCLFPFCPKHVDTNCVVIKEKPGILSALSPTSDMISTNWAGVSVPYFLAKSSMPNEVILEKNRCSVRDPRRKLLHKKQAVCEAQRVLCKTSSLSSHRGGQREAFTKKLFRI